MLVVKHVCRKWRSHEAFMARHRGGGMVKCCFTCTSTCLLYPQYLTIRKGDKCSNNSVVTVLLLRKVRRSHSMRILPVFASPNPFEFGCCGSGDHMYCLGLRISLLDIWLELSFKIAKSKFAAMTGIAMPWMSSCQ